MSSGKWTVLGQTNKIFLKKFTVAKSFILIKNVYILEFVIFQGLMHEIQNIFS